ncbi:MAG: aminoacyl-tRNA hydrolase [bacterium]|nr:aminoacyl-tRNA hydrolase [bacterium]
MYTIVGLGNPGEEYKETRHNVGRMAIEFIANKHKIEATFNKKYFGLYGKGSIGKESVQLLMPDTFMNKSGKSVVGATKSKKAIEQTIVIYDDLDLPLGNIKISFNRSSGGHRGIESIINALKTKNFIRIRIGISPTTQSGKIKKPLGEEKVEKHILGKFSQKEKEILTKMFEIANTGIERIIEKGLSVAMSQLGK